MKKIIVTIAVPVVLASMLFMCSQQEKKENQPPVLDEAAVPVKLTEVKQGEYSLPISSSGLITTENEARLSFKIGGIVNRILVEEGQSVAKGQLLASLDLTEINAQVSLAKENLEKTRRDLERGKKLRADSAATLEQLQNLQTAFDAATQSYRIATFNQEYASIRATASGKVIHKFVNEGEQVGPGMPVLMINSAAQNDWIVKIGLPDVDWVRVRKGDKAIVTTDAYPGLSFTSHVSVVNEGADVISGLYQAEVSVKPNGKKLASGLFAKVEIIPSEKRNLKSVPIEALVEGSGRHAFVFAPNGDNRTVKKIMVKVAFIKDNLAFLEQGLENIPNVITAGSAFLTESSTIHITI